MPDGWSRAITSRRVSQATCLLIGDLGPFQVGPHRRFTYRLGVFGSAGIVMGRVVADSATAEHDAARDPRFALAKFRPPALPDTLVVRSRLHDQLTAGAGRRLTSVVGSAGAGKSVLLADWTASRPAGVTAWLSCDSADADPLRFWAGFIEAPRAIEPAFGRDAADLLAMNRHMSADVIASIANDAAKLPEGSAIIVDDFHIAAPAVARDMTDLVECWPAETTQLVLAGRFDPPLRLHRLRISAELCEVRDRDLYFSLADSRDLMANFGVRISDADLAVLHQRSEGWPAALQMTALSLRSTTDPARVARALRVRSQEIADYFIAEVLDQQPPEVARFMLDTSVLSELTADTCAAISGARDAAALLHAIDAAHLFLVPVDEERTRFRCHRLVRQIMRAELRARDPARERMLELRAAEHFESAGDVRRAARHFLAARQGDRALALLRDRVMTDFLHDPALPGLPDLNAVDPSVLVDAPDELLALAADLLLSGDTVRGGEYLDLLERVRPSIPPESRLAARVAAIRSFRYAVTGQLPMAVGEALRARAIQEQTHLSDEWNAAVPSSSCTSISAWKPSGRRTGISRSPGDAFIPRTGQAGTGTWCPGADTAGGRPPGRGGRCRPIRRCRRPAAGIRPAFLRHRSPARAGRPRAGAARHRHRRAPYRAGAAPVGAAAAAL